MAGKLQLTLICMLWGRDLKEVICFSKTFLIPTRRVAQTMTGRLLGRPPNRNPYDRFLEWACTLVLHACSRGLSCAYPASIVVCPLPRQVMRELIMPCTDSNSIALSTRTVALFGPIQDQTIGPARFLQIFALTVGQDPNLYPFVWRCEGAQSAVLAAVQHTTVLKAKLQKPAHQ